MDTTQDQRVCRCGLRATDEAWEVGDRGCPDCTSVWPECLRTRTPGDGGPPIRTELGQLPCEVCGTGGTRPQACETCGFRKNGPDVEGMLLRCYQLLNSFPSADIIPQELRRWALLKKGPTTEEEWDADFREP